MSEERKSLIEEIILKYEDGKEPITISAEGCDEEKQLDMQLFTEQLMKCKYNGFSVSQRPGIDFELDKVTSIEFKFKPKY